MKLIKILSVFILLIAGTITVNAQQAATDKPTIVFVHGIWADGSSWAIQISALQAEGYNVLSVQNSLISLVDDVAATKRAIDMAPGKVILVGHSWGGFVITQAGNNPKVAALVYVAAFAPNTGETVPILSANGPGTDIFKYFVASGAFIYLSEDGVKNAFAQDLNPEQQKLIYATQIPAVQSVFGEKSGAPAWKQKPNWFIVTKNDKALNPDLQRFMAKRINAKTTEIESGHVVMTSHPAEVLSVIKEAINSIK